MAFNPFSWFRKHQKLFFAGLVLICMFVFILQFGKGDALTQMMSWISGRGSGKGPVVASVHGSKVTVGDLDELLAKRRAADRFQSGRRRRVGSRNRR